MRIDIYSDCSSYQLRNPTYLYYYTYYYLQQLIDGETIYDRMKRVYEMQLEVTQMDGRDG